MFNPNVIPVETAFMSNSSKARRDPLIKNRIHFEFPEQWNNSNNYNRVVGIRNMFISKQYLKPEFKINYTLLNKVSVPGSTDTPPVPVKTETITIHKFFDDSVLLKDLIIEINKKLNEIDLSDYFNENHFFIKDQLSIINQTKPLFSYFEFLPDHHTRFVLKSPFNDLDKNIRSATQYENSRVVSINEYSINFDITDANEDAQKILIDRSGNFDPNPIYFNNVWDHNSCIIYSNLSEQSDNGYLGHTRKQNLAVVKYYKVNGSNRSFWVDLFATVEHKTPVILPEGDELIIEAQLY